MIQTVGIISRPRREDIARIVPPLLDWLKAHGAQAYCDPETTDSIGALAQHSRKREELPQISDLLIVLGGDGTLLAAAREAADYKVPILAVNAGGMGFLTTVAPDELYPLLEEVFSNRFRISERVMLEAQVVREGAVIAQHSALNDAVINKSALARIIDVEMRLDGEYVTTYKADGLIVSTPTGSTAYSLSAGGPIVYPLVDAFVITPICPHTITNRPLVVPDKVHIELFFGGGDAPVFLTVDGQVGIRLEPLDHVAIRKSTRVLRLVRSEKKQFYGILRSKLKWGER